MIVVYVAVALLAPVIAPCGESQILGSAFAPWSDEHILGTDQLGRDMLSRLLDGACNAVGIAFLTTVLAFLIGGLLAAVLRGWTDQLLGRVVDVLMAIPQLIFALLLLSTLGPSATNLIVIIAAEFGLRFCFVFLTISALCFLGLGIQPPTADWGSMVRENVTLITYTDVTPLLPAGAIALLTVAVNFVVDWFLHKSSGLRDEP